mmetsp:Transcript_11091/g.34014  ORF Transcript_11091/g.34014 Transcript_11091/m.34014 type:complete len:106 (-) Transcript_11091:338-655(-)
MTTSSVATSEHMAPPRTPFASVGDVAPNSLASTAGLQSGDQIVLFGSVESRGYGDNTSAVQAIPRVLRDHHDVAMPLVVLRGGELLEFTLTPSATRPLGCRVFPI